MKSKDLDQFYTKTNIAEKCFSKILTMLNEEQVVFDLWLEPSAGTGSFFNLLPNNKIGIDLDPQISNVILHDFITYELPEKRLITIGNPPFGKNSSLAIKFFNKCAEKSLYIAFILPRTFKKQSTLKKLNQFFHLVYEEDLPEFSFEFNGEDYDVPCVFQIWKKLEKSREKIEHITKHPDFNFTTKDKAKYAIQRVGVNAGKLKEEFFNCSQSSHYFINSSQEVKNIFKLINWDSVKYNTAGNPSISKSEVISLYEQYKLIKQ